jgi:hypothetical protein
MRNNGRADFGHDLQFGVSVSLRVRVRVFGRWWSRLHTRMFATT